MKRIKVLIDFEFDDKKSFCFTHDYQIRNTLQIELRDLLNKLEFWEQRRIKNVRTEILPKVNSIKIIFPREPKTKVDASEPKKTKRT